MFLVFTVFLIDILAFYLFIYLDKIKMLHLQCIAYQSKKSKNSYLPEFLISMNP